MQRFVCVHGHFYQPPRENAWLDLLEAQPSARPYHDWNERITAECYRSNSRARILGDHERIIDITNNYERISFNVGPTLLSWLERHAPSTYEGILAADVASRERFSGHGSAMAQNYGHMIMPLATPRDRRTQVRWGVVDFERRFGRKPEGMWLAETAVCTDTLEALAEEGIAFTILAPRQARTIRPSGRVEPIAVDESTLDTTKPYRVDLPSGKSIAVFFYNGGISQAVAFERLLSDGARFAARLATGFREDTAEPQLCHIATDGETYGHHHPFGEMALAFALRSLEASEIQLTNYGEFLARFPPKDIATIHENTAWSCYHGVGRWSEDCGCRMRAGSDQAWRKPLRAALDALRAEIDPSFEARGSVLFRDPWAARDAYIDVVLDRSKASLDAFFGAVQSHPLDAKERTVALELLELQRFGMLMYTSCGWFFDDIDGIEAVQVLQYAVRTAELSESLGNEGALGRLLERLATAKAREKPRVSTRSAKDAVVELVLPARVDMLRAAARHAVCISLTESAVESSPVFEVAAQRAKHAELGNTRLVVGEVTLRDAQRDDAIRFGFAVVHFGGIDFAGAVGRVGPDDDGAAFEAELFATFARGESRAVLRLIEARYERPIESLTAVFPDDRTELVETLLSPTIDEVLEDHKRLHDACAPLLRSLATLGVEPPRALRAASKLYLSTEILHGLEREEPDFSKLLALADEAKSEDVRIDPGDLQLRLSALVERASEDALADPTPELLDALFWTVSFARRVLPSASLRHAEDAVWMLKTRGNGGERLSELCRILGLTRGGV